MSTQTTNGYTASATPDAYYIQGALEFHSLSSYGEFPEPHRPAPETAPDLGKEWLSRGSSPSLTAVADILKSRRSTRQRRARLDLPTAKMMLQTALAPDEATGQWPYPSAGDLRAVTVYCAAFDVVGTERRITQFDPRTGHLRPLSLSAHTLGEHELRGETLLRTSAVDPATVQAVLLFVGNLSRVGGRYGERAYRYLLLEAGHMAQNLSLVLAAQSLAGCPIGGIHDDEARKVLGLVDPTEICLYGLAIP